MHGIPLGAIDLHGPESVRCAWPATRKRFYSAPTTLDSGESCEVAIKTYDKLRRESDSVATGQWLEHLVLEKGIHPATARRQPQASSERCLVNRMTEGSTPQTACDQHALRVLNVVDGVACSETVYLYVGEVLILGKASSSLKLERIQS